MTRPSDTEAVTLTDDERGRLLCDVGCEDQHSKYCAAAMPNIYRVEIDADDLCERVSAILAARLAGAGAQVTEAAVEAAAEALAKRDGVDRFYTAVYRDVARAALSAGAPHMGTGQSEADLRARISALADKWDEIAKRASNRHDWKGSEIREWCADDLRALLDRPAAEGDHE